MKSPSWRQFEIAVTQFLGALDPSASVTHNAILPDRDSGEPRQRDVWIETKILGLFPIRILVSCKKLRRRLHQNDIDSFAGELMSSGANIGVIYSYCGFGKAAIQKALAKGIHCCQLFEDAPAELPPKLTVDYYFCTPICRARIEGFPVAGLDLETWSDVFNLRVLDSKQEPQFLLDVLAALYREDEEKAVREFSIKSLTPRDIEARVELASTCATRGFTVILQGAWKLYRSKVEAILLNGTYLSTSEVFAGSYSSPWVDLKSGEPGPGWEEVVARHESPDGRTFAALILYNSNLKESILKNVGATKLVLDSL